MMPYVITATTPYHDEERGADTIVTRRAVATLDEARTEARKAAAMVKHRNGAEFQAINHAMSTADDLPESGGTVGPLPDGTVIEVEPMVNEFGRPDVRGYLRGWHFPASMDDAEIIDAYNAEQVSA